jgi:hypothetical protein
VRNGDERNEANRSLLHVRSDAMQRGPLQAHCHLGVGNLYAKIRRHTMVRADLSAAIGLYQAMDMMVRLPEGEAALTEAGSSPTLPKHRERGRSLG